MELQAAHRQIMTQAASAAGFWYNIGLARF
jgi:hypothetical protein